MGGAAPHFRLSEITRPMVMIADIKKYKYRMCNQICGKIKKKTVEQSINLIRQTLIGVQGNTSNKKNCVFSFELKLLSVTISMDR